MDKVFSLLGWCCCCFNSQPVLSINRAKFTVLKLLGEGGFSYVYEVQASNGAIYALKKIRCPFGAESVKTAMKEVHNYSEFHSPYIIRAIDSSVVQEEDGSKTVYILLPYFDGSLQDLINKQVMEGTHIEEAEAVRLFIGMCRGVQTMHRHHVSPQGPSMEESVHQDDDEHDALLASMTNDSTVDTVISNGPMDELDATELQETVAYAHKDIKPANVMLSKDGMPVLCDLGSCSKARVRAKTRSAAITIQEAAAEHCTLPYRAPELLDVKTGSTIDEKIDIWSLGCTLYALLYGCSPFEREESVNGGSMNMAILQGKYSFPEGYSSGVEELVKMCLVVDPQQRPAVEQVLAKALEVQG
jgi:serine/threonine kinase 16